MRAEIVINLDPISHFVCCLEARYSNIAAFFYDSIGGRSVGVKWRGDIDGKGGVVLTAAQAQNAGNQHGKSSETSIAVRAVLADMACLGAGLIAGVQYAQ